MPKSRGRKNLRSRERISKRQVAQRTQEILEAQRQRFREKFGRDPGPSDPVFFNPDAPEPVPMSAVKLQAETVETMRKAGTPPHLWLQADRGLTAAGGHARQIASKSGTARSTSISPLRRLR